MCNTQGNRTLLDSHSGARFSVIGIYSIEIKKNKFHFRFRPQSFKWIGNDFFPSKDQRFTKRTHTLDLDLENYYVVNAFKVDHPVIYGKHAR